MHKLLTLQKSRLGRASFLSQFAHQQRRQYRRLQINEIRRGWPKISTELADLNFSEENVEDLFDECAQWQSHSGFRAQLEKVSGVSFSVDKEEGKEEEVSKNEEDKSEESPKEEEAQPEPQPAPQPQTQAAVDTLPSEDELLGGGGGGGSGSGGGDDSKAEEEAMPEEEMAEEDIYYGMTPKEMISELDRFVIGQSAAKKAVAIAWRSRWRRRKLPVEMRPEVLPKNILMMGPTGCGKTEVARRLAKLSQAPFVKVEATKFTEVGYVGKDVNSIIEDLVGHAANLVKTRKQKQMKKMFERKVEDIILKLLMGKSPMRDMETFRRQLRAGMLDNFKVEVETKKEPELPSFVPSQRTLMILGGVPESTVEKKLLPINKAREVLMEQETKKALSEKTIAEEAVKLAAEDGIVFIDEIDKICGSRGMSRGDQKVSQEGVQRDLLPLIEGSSVQVNNYGKVDTDHILFICAGAFHDSKPSDLMPEFQGRLPVRVRLETLTRDDLYRILTETEFNLISQQVEMLKTESYDLNFTDGAINEIADVAATVNSSVENIGARRLVTVIEKVMEEVNLDAPESDDKKFTVDENYVRSQVTELLEKSDYTKFVL